jgi:hypothetical protein
MQMEEAVMACNILYPLRYLLQAGYRAGQQYLGV